MNRAGMLTELRGVLNDSTVDGVWEESTLLGYLAEGQDKFCEETGFFNDITNYSITLRSGVAVYAIPDRVIQIMDIWDGTRRLQKRLTEERGVLQVNPYIPANKPYLWQTDLETGAVKIFPTPNADTDGLVLQLQVWRYSRYDLAGDGPVPEGGGDAPDAEPEIPSRFHRACIEWAAYKAFNHHDMEAQDPVKAEDHLKAFMRYVVDGRLALVRLHNEETRVGTNPAYVV